MKRIPEAVRRISKKTWIIVAAAAAAVLMVIGFASCSAPPPSAQDGDFSGEQASDVGCHSPLACGPYYAGYIPPYYAAHPASVYLSPYRAFYTPVLIGHSYSTSRSPAGIAPVTARPPMPYPAGYKPVPGNFQAPTAPKVPAVKVPAVKAPAVKVPTRRK